MKNNQKMKYYYSFEKQLKTITNSFYYRYKKILNLEWNEFKQMVDWEFFNFFEKFIESDKIIEKKLYIEIKDNVKDQIKKIYLTNRSGKGLNTGLDKTHNYLNNTYLPTKNDVSDDEFLNALTKDIDYYYQEETKEVILRYKKTLNLSEKETEFLFAWSKVNYNKKKLARENKIYNRNIIDNLQEVIKIKLLNYLKGY